MKIGIITVFYSENSGSFLQAFSLEKKLKELGHDVIYINTKNKYSSHSLKLLIARIIKECVKLNFSDAFTAFKRYYSFKKVIKRFKYIDLNSIVENKIDAIIIGSDTVWNIEEKYFFEGKNIFFPICPQTKIISYAASVGNTTKEFLGKFDFVKESLQKMDTILVRDNYSQKTISSITQNEVSIVCDPTILMDIKVFDEFKTEIKDKNFILIYAFNNFSVKVIDQIKKFAQEKNLKIISVGKKYDWCDKEVTVSVNNFISYFSNANYIITNTFHGNVFSILYNKQFLCIDLSKKKILELLKEYGLEDRRCNEEGNICKLLEEKINYYSVNEKLLENKEKSLKFLKDSLYSS